MKSSNYLKWFRRLAILGAVVAGVTASAAGAVPMLDPQDTPADPAVSHSTAQWLSAPGLRWQAIAKARQNVSHSTPLGLRADGLRWQAIAKQYQQSRPVPAPDVIERYVVVHSKGSTAVSAVGTDRIVDDSFRDTARYVPAASDGNSGLDGANFGIGAMLGLGLLAAGLGLGAVAMRHRTGKLGAS